MGRKVAKQSFLPSLPRSFLPSLPVAGIGNGHYMPRGALGRGDDVEGEDAEGVASLLGKGWKEGGREGGECRTLFFV